MKDFFYKMFFNSEKYIKYLRKLGCQIGNDVSLYRPLNTITIDITRPWLISIGNHVRITKGVTILTHDYGWSVIKGISGEILGSAKETKIGNNVFIGVNTTITGGVTIGDNVIIGANSLVSKDIPSGVVAAGNPAKVLCTIEQYAKKRKEKQLDEATNMTIKYFETYGKWPTKNILREFIWLFEDRETDIDKDKVFTEIGHLCGNYEKTKAVFKKNKGKFDNFNHFIEYCREKSKHNS